MSDEEPNEYLVLSRGQWDETLPPERIQTAIDDFYVWIDRQCSAGKMRRGQRLARESRIVSRRGVIDGPFAEAREVIGGYWIVLANSLDEAANLMTGNPCSACGLSYEIRPIEKKIASAFDVTNETPASRASS